MTDKIIIHLTDEQKREMDDYALSLYLKGIKGRKAAEMIQNKAPNDLGPSQAYKIFHYAKQKYLLNIPSLNVELIQKEAVNEMEEFEEEIRDMVREEDSHKYKVILDTKKHKHSIQGIGKDNAQVEISITSNLDNDFLAAQNENVIDITPGSDDESESPRKKNE